MQGLISPPPFAAHSIWTAWPLSLSSQRCASVSAFSNSANMARSPAEKLLCGCRVGVNPGLSLTS
jgi:hypothetical protein